MPSRIAHDGWTFYGAHGWVGEWDDTTGFYFLVMGEEHKYPHWLLSFSS